MIPIFGKSLIGRSDRYYAYFRLDRNSDYDLIWKLCSKLEAQHRVDIDLPPLDEMPNDGVIPATGDFEFKYPNDESN